MVAVVMGKCILDTRTWTGFLGMHLGGEMYVDMSGELESGTYLSKQMILLLNELQSKGIEPLPGIICSYFTFHFHGRENYSF